ncbi:uroporphyrinogen-III C-methyltransferase [Rheinheimera sp. WS51]|uniref:uroporphyrinogen-III C-methyltransferase n=1 Tax=Rheinheimera sp. WS51 TaxID=3425886 RepID=UPI003D94ACD9
MSETVVRASEADEPLKELKQKIDDEQQQENTKKPSQGLAAFSLLLIILLIAAMAAAVYWLWPQWQSLQQQSAQMQQLQQRVSAQVQQQQNTEQQLLNTLSQQQSAKLGQLELQLAQTEQRLSLALQQALTEQQVQIQALRQQVQTKDSAPPRHWLLAETDYLLQLAAKKVWLEHDFTTAISLLNTAQEKLIKIDDPSLLLVRQAINQDIEQLRQLPTIDLSEVHLQLQQARKLTAQLALKQQHNNAMPQLTKPEGGVKQWRQTLHYYWQQAWSNLFTVRSAVPEDYFSLSKEQQLMLRSSLSQHLLLAELAALEQNETVYLAALEQAISQLGRYFDPANDEVSQLQSQLQQLATVNISKPELKALSSVSQMQQYQQQLEESSL